MLPKRKCSKALPARRPLAGCIRILLVAVALYGAEMNSRLFGQTSPWVNGAADAIYYNLGNVGIGTTSPGAPLHLVGSSGSFYRGVGALVVGRSAAGGAAGHVFEESTGNATLLSQYANTFSIWRHSGTGPFLLADQKFSIDPNGNVGIGTAAPQYKLAVNGTIGAKEVIVTTTGWADYVLQPSYRLAPLSEVNTYIQAHHHLPDIPSAAEVKEKGVSVGEMQSKLLAKVEELTLHMIQQDKENRGLREHMNQQEKENWELRRRIAQLEVRAAGSNAPSEGQ